MIDITAISDILIPVVGIGAVAAFILVLWKIYQPYIDNIRKKRKTPEPKAKDIDAWFEEKFKRLTNKKQRRGGGG